jgi:hypothetical protein
MDDVAKKQIASWLGQGKKEAQADWLGRIHMFSGIISLGMSFGLTGPRAIQIALKVGQTTLSAIKSGCDHQLNTLNAGIIEIESATKRSDVLQSRYVKELEENTRTIYEYYQNLQTAEEQRQTAVRTMFQKV